MIYKTLCLLVMFTLFLGVNKSNAQCDCIEDISAAVEAVMGTSGCDGPGEWKAPKSLEVHLAKLENWCDNGGVKPWKSKVPNIVQAMLEVIEDAYEGEWNEDLQEWDEIPAPECAWDELDALISALACGD